MVYRNKCSLFVLIVAFNVLNSQAVYNNAVEGLKWLETAGHGNSNPWVMFEADTFLPGSQPIPWNLYTGRKLYFDNMDNGFGLVGHAAGQPKSRLGLYQDSDLIGDGFLTLLKYRLGYFKIVNSMFFTDNPHDGARGYIRTVKNVTMYTNQAFINYRRAFNDLSIDLKFGRDHLRIGHGIKGALFMSDFSRPFDQFTIQVQRKYLSGIFSVLELDPFDEYNRTLYLHAIKFKSKKLELTVAESLMKTGKGLPSDLSLLNPILPWTWEEVDREDTRINGFLYGGFTWYPQTGWRLFGEILVDDVNFHHPDAFYLNRFGFLTGIQKTGFPFSTSNLWVEYSNILNQVYQSYQPYHIYTHRNYPIGHYLGNDFDHWHIHYSQLSQASRLRPYFDITYTRDGANGLDTPFDNPWEDEDGLLPDYEPPPHPTAPVTYVFETEVGTEFTWGDNGSLSVSGFYSRRTLSGKTEDNWSLVIRLWISIFRPIK